MSIPSLDKQMNHIEKMCRDHFNEPVLVGFQVGRLIGYGEDDCDCYLAIHYPKYPNGEVRYHTAVGGYIFLRTLRDQHVVNAHNGERWDDYYRIDNMLSLNGAPKATEFLVQSLPNSDSGAEADLKACE